MNGCHPPEIKHGCLRNPYSMAQMGKISCYGRGIGKKSLIFQDRAMGYDRIHVSFSLPNGVVDLLLGKTHSPGIYMWTYGIWEYLRCVKLDWWVLIAVSAIYVLGFGGCYQRNYILSYVLRILILIFSSRMEDQADPLPSGNLTWPASSKIGIYHHRTHGPTYIYIYPYCKYTHTHIYII